MEQIRHSSHKEPFLDNEDLFACDPITYAAAAAFPALFASVCDVYPESLTPLCVGDRTQVRHQRYSNGLFQRFFQLRVLRRTPVGPHARGSHTHSSALCRAHTCTASGQLQLSGTQ